MLVNVYTIRDCLAEESSFPMTAKNDGVAARMFARTMLENPCEPTSFKLLHIGTFDTERTILLASTSVREVEVDLDAFKSHEEEKHE